MQITKEKIDKLIQLICDLYLVDDIPWVIGYSGGKDSTAALQLVWMAINTLPTGQRKKKPVHVISTDTLVESPVVASWVNNSLRFMKDAAVKQDMPIETHRLIPEWGDTFWVNLLGRGYPFPRPNFRWCTDRLKIKPSNNFVNNVVSAYGEVILILGTRKAESKSRARTMEYYEKRRVREYLSPNGSIQNELIFSPLEEWTDDEVWTFLLQFPNPWGYSNKDLLTMYRGATSDGECPLVINTDTPSCGKSRFGCWVCTMVEQDKSMAAMITNDSEKEWMLPLLEFRNEIGDHTMDRDRRDFRKMTGRVHLYHGKLVHGPYKKEVREMWLRKLLTIQKLIQTTGPQFNDIKLITNEELCEIRRIWLDDKHEFDDALPKIFFEVTGEVLDDPKVSVSDFGKDEWDMLTDTCNDLYPGEELLSEMSARILDIEQKDFGAKKRKEILSLIEKQIHRCFFKNESDAEQYANVVLDRRKQFKANFDQDAFSEDEDADDRNADI